MPGLGQGILGFYFLWLFKRKGSRPLLTHKWIFSSEFMSRPFDAKGEWKINSVTESS